MDLRDAEHTPFGESIPPWDSSWYATAEAQQVSVRLPVDLVQFADAMVEQGYARSRAAVVTLALERELRHQRAEDDARNYARREEDIKSAIRATRAAQRSQRGR